MQTTAVRLHGAYKMSMDRFDLPAITEDEVLIKVISDSLCTSTYKAYKQGAAHKRVPENVEEVPIIVGHELCAEVVEVGTKLTDDWKVGDKCIIQAALRLPDGHDPGYSYPYVGGAATYAVVPKKVLDRDCLLPYKGNGIYKASLVEPIACCLRGYKGMYHIDPDSYDIIPGTKKGGKVAILGGAGPMGLASAALAGSYGEASMCAVVDISADRLELASRKFPSEASEKFGCKLHYVNTSDVADPAAMLRELSGGGFDDVLVMVPVPALFTLAEQICAFDGCVNFFAGPADKGLMGQLNLYRIHYEGVHIVGTAGSTPDDMRDTIRLIEQDRIDPAIMVSHILGLNAYADTIAAMEKPGGAKKLCYNHINLPIVALDDLAEAGKNDPMLAELAKIVDAHNGLWCVEAEEYLLANAKGINE